MGEYIHVFQSKQQGVPCSIKGCDDTCISNGLCSKHNMKKKRATEKGRAYTKEYNKRYKKPDIQKTCELCSKGYVTARKTQRYCSECSKTREARIAGQKRCRAKNLEKYRARDMINKRIDRDARRRGFIDNDLSPLKEPCEICGRFPAEAHHHDYSKPLDVTWLCKDHHAALHRFEANGDISYPEKKLIPWYIGTGVNMVMRTDCRVGTCDNDNNGNGLCSKHYFMLKTYGTTDGRPVQTFVCTHCGGKFQSKNKRGYCSEKCRHRDRRLRLKGL